MKTIKLTVIGLALFLSNILNAQVSVNVNIGSPPMWGPVGYTEVRYYYIPDIETYYDIQTASFIYIDNGIWIHRTYLPVRYRHYDLYGGYKVVLTDYHGHSPYVHYHKHKTKYIKGYHGRAQQTIGERPGKGNYKVKQIHNENKRMIKGSDKNIERNNNQSPKKNHGQGGNGGKGNKSGGGGGKGNGKKK